MVHSIINTSVRQYSPKMAGPVFARLWLLLLALTFASVRPGSAKITLSDDLLQEQTKDDLISLVKHMKADLLQHIDVKLSIVEKLETRVKELEESLERKCECGTASNDAIEPNTKDGQTHTKDASVTSSVNTTNQNIRRGIRQVPEKVAFSTVVSKDQTHLGLRQVIKYDNVILNTGSGYSPNSGVFTTPTSGTYLFMYHLGHHGTGETFVEIKKNGAVLNGLGVEGTGPSQNLQGSNSVILNLSKGDEVWIEVFQVNDVSIHGLFTTFSGVLLH